MATSSRPKLCTKETVKREGLNIWVDSTLDGIEPKIDIILVQGLGAHPYYTWVGRQDRTTAVATTSSRPNLRRFLGRGKAGKHVDTSPSVGDGAFWPRDLLPKHVGPARIATYSYLSAWEKKDFRTSLRECGEQFLNIVHQSRQDESTRNRPIIFVGHSLGGLVIQQALVLADHNKIFTDIRTSTSGIIFLGVPMQGSKAAGILTIFTDAIGNEQPMLKTLKAGSTELYELSDDFWSSYEALPAMFFCETNDSHYVPLLNTMIVNVRSSSVIGKRTISLHTDHSGLNKFREDDEKFHLFVPSLKEMVTLAQRNSCAKAKREKNDDVPAMGMDRAIPQDLDSVTSRVILPFPKDDDFVGRKDVLEKIEKISHSTRQDSRVALVGLGGIGKSQIAIEYAHQFRAKYPERSIFWVYGTNPARFRASYTEIAKELRLSGCDDPKQDKLDTVRRWFQSEASGQWLMILDNVDDRSFVAEYHNKAAMIHEFTLLAHLPRKPGTMILITSRDRDAAYDLVHQKHNHILEIDCMDVPDTKALLDVKLDDPQAAEAEKEQLIRKLDSIPLAITQAAAYIKRRRMVTTSTYLKLLDACEKDPKSILNVDGGDSRRDPGVPNAVFRTWQITPDLIQVQNPASANLLSIMAMFDRQGIPRFLFNPQTESSITGGDESNHSEYASNNDHHEGMTPPVESSHGSDGNPSSTREDRANSACQALLATNQVSNLKQERLDYEHDISTDNDDKHFGPFDETVEILLDLSLVSIEKSGETFQMHRLVQLATRQWLKDHNSYQYVSEKALHILTLAYPSDIDKDWKLCQTLEPHADSVHERIYQPRKSRLDHARLSRSRADFFHFQGLYSRAEASAEMAVKEYGAIGEYDSEECFWAVVSSFWADIDGKRGRTESEILTVLHHVKAVLGEENQTYINMLRAQGWLLFVQGRHKEAADILRTALDLARKAIGDQHHLTLQCSRNLAWALWEVDRIEEAEELCVSNIDIQRRTLGESHPRTLDNMHILANVNFSQGRMKESEMMRRKHILQLTLGVLGDKHKNTLIAKFNLACSLAKQGRVKEAAAIKLDVLSGETELLGTDHPSTIYTMASLAHNYMDHGNHSEAVNLMTKAVHLSDGALGYSHPHTEARTEWLKEWYCVLQQDDTTRHHVFQAEEQAKVLIQERYSRSLMECILEIHFQRACQIRTSADSSEIGSDYLVPISKDLVAALRMWIDGNWQNGLRTIGRVLGLMGRGVDAQIAFEGLAKWIPPFEGSLRSSSKSGTSSDALTFPAENVSESSKDNVDAADCGMVHGQRNQQDPREVEGEAESVSGIGGLTNSDRQRLPREHLPERSRDDSNGSVIEYTEDADRSGGTAEDSGENRSSVSSGHDSNVWKNTAWGDSAWCDGCKEVFQLPSTRYFCIECSYIDLCEACYDKLEGEGTSASNKMKDCKGHKYLSAPRSEWYDLPWGEVSEEGTTLMEWAEKLLSEFSE